MSDHVSITRARGAQLAPRRTISRRQGEMACGQNQNSETHYPTFPAGAPFTVLTIDVTGTTQNTQFFTAADIWIREITYIVAKGKPAVYTPQEPPIWSDVVNTPQSGMVRIRRSFDDFAGTYALHRHILAHEHRGMMRLVRTIPANSGPATACKLNGVQHH